MYIQVVWVTEVAQKELQASLPASFPFKYLSLEIFREPLNNIYLVPGALLAFVLQKSAMPEISIRKIKEIMPKTGSDVDIVYDSLYACPKVIKQTISEP